MKGSFLFDVIRPAGWVRVGNASEFKSSEGGLHDALREGARTVPFGPHERKANSSLASANSQQMAELNLPILDEYRGRKLRLSDEEQVTLFDGY